MSAQDLQAALSVLDPAAGPRLFVLKVDLVLTAQQAERMHVVLTDRLSEFGTFIVLGRGYDLQVLTAGQLRDLGLVRISEPSSSGWGATEA